MNKNSLPVIATAVLLASLLSCGSWADERGFPFMLPKEKPDRPLSAAMERNYTAYPAPRPERN